MTTLIITDDNDNEYKFNIDESKYEDAIEMAMKNKGCAGFDCNKCPFLEEADEDPTFRHFCENVIDDSEWTNIKKVEELVGGERKEMGKLTFKQIKEAMKKGEVIFLDDKSIARFRVIEFTRKGSLITESLSSGQISTWAERAIADFKIAGPEHKKYYKWAYKLSDDATLKETDEFLDNDCRDVNGNTRTVIATCALKKKLMYTEITLEDLRNG